MTWQPRRRPAIDVAHLRRAAPSVALVQLPQVASVLGAVAACSVPSACEPVRMSCWFGVSPTPLIVAPFSVSAVSFLRLFMSECRVATSLAIDLAFDVHPWTLADAIRALTAGCPAAAATLR